MGDGWSMRTAILSDIHANLPALDACLRDARQRGAARFVFLGDLVGLASRPRPRSPRSCLRIEGETLEAKLANGPLPAGEVARARRSPTRCTSLDDAHRDPARRPRARAPRETPTLGRSPPPPRAPHVPRHRVRRPRCPDRGLRPTQQRRPRRRRSPRRGRSRLRPIVASTVSAKARCRCREYRRAGHRPNRSRHRSGADSR